MSRPIRIIVTADTAQAAAALRAFVAQANSGLHQIGGAGAAGAAGIAATGKEAEQAAGSFEKLGGKVYFIRGGIDAIRYAAAGGGVRAAFYAMDEAMRGLMQTGIGLATVAPPLAVLVAAVGAGVLVWREWTSAERDAAEAAKTLAEAWKTLPPLMKEVADAQEAGMISGAGAQRIKDIASGNLKQYRDNAGNIHDAPGFDIIKGTGAPSNPMGGPWGDQTQQVPWKQLSPPEAQARAKDLLTAGGQGASEQQIAAKKEFDELVRKANEDELDGIAKTEAANHDKYQKLRDDAQAAYDVMNAKMGGVNLPDESARLKNTLAAYNLAELKANQEARQKADDDAAKKKADAARAQSETLARLARERDEQLKAIDDAAKKQAAADKQHADALRKQKELADEVARSLTSAQLKSLQDNPFLTEEQKAAQSVPVLQTAITQNTGRQKDLRVEGNDPANPERLEAQKQYNEAVLVGVDLQKKLAAAQGETSYSHQMAGVVKSLQDQNNLAREIAKTFGGVFNTAVQSVSQGLTQILLYTGSWQKKLQEVGVTIVTSIVQGIVQMGVRWLMTQLMMALGGRALMAATVASTAPMATAQAAIWAVPATLSTIATDGASAEAAPAEIQAAQAATLKGSSGSSFAQGGYTGAGGSGEVAGIVHRGEFVVPADVVNRVGLGPLQSLRDGGYAGYAGTPDSGGSSMSVKNIFVTDPKSAMLEALASPAGEKVIVTHVNRNKTKLGLTT